MTNPTPAAKADEVSSVDERVIEYGTQYLVRRFPLLQTETERDIHNTVADLMFMGKNMKPIPKHEDRRAWHNRQQDAFSEAVEKAERGEFETGGPGKYKVGSP